MDPSPSSCNYVYSLECALRIESLSSVNKKGSVSASNAKITVGRNETRDIVLQIELLSARTNGFPAVASYPLAECTVHQTGIEKGQGSIEISKRGLIVFFNNCAPRKLNVFLKSLKAKLDLMKVEDKQNVNKTPVTNARAAILAGIPRIFNVLSPLTVGEIRKIRRIRGVATGQSPLASRDTNRTMQSPLSTKNPLAIKRNTATTPVTAKRKSTEVEKIPSMNLVEGVSLTVEQRQVIRTVVQAKRSVFFTGSAGTGKSLVLRKLIELLPAQTTFITAATGVAACQLGGVTLHSFAGIGVSPHSPETALKVAMSNKNIVKQWKTCTHLVVDEISMVDADYFTALEYVARNIRSIDRPFGGIQMIITGDFLQLPPVVKGREEPKFCFESSAWETSVDKTIILETVKRQDDMEFVNLLHKVRHGKCDDESSVLLRRTSSTNFDDLGIVPTRLCSHTADSDTVNQSSLKELKTPPVEFIADDETFIPDTLKSNVPRIIILKTGAQVMLNKNIDLARGLSNGSRGVVTSFAKNGNPVVKFVNDLEIEVRRVRFSVRIPGAEQPAVRRQVPLQLAWAISIHKSQGLTLDAVEVGLARVFAEGQAYVALSRARSLNAIKINGFDASVIRANKKVLRYYESIKSEEDNDDFVIHKRSRLSL